MKNKVVRASIILLVGTILSKILGFARELMVAYRFGAGNVSDAFVLTNGIPSLVFVSFATAINVNYIPYFHRIEGEEERNRFTSNLTSIIFVTLMIGCLIICLIPKPILKLFAAGLPAETERYAVAMMRIVVFAIIPIMLSYLYQAYLQANGSFASTVLFGIVTNIVVILFTIIASEKRYYLLSVGTITANLIGFLMVFINVKRKTLFMFIPCLDFKDKRIKEIIILTVPLLVEDLASSMSLLVDRNLASFLDKGTISGLGYAGTVGNIASTMIATAIMTATFPLFSKMLATGKREEFIVLFKKYASVISFLLGPISIFIILNSNSIVTLIFEHGAFNNTATIIVSESLICYVVGVLPLGLQSYLIRGFYAMQDTKTPVKIKVFALFCNIIMNLVFVRFIKHMGIALSTSISYLIAYFLLIHSLRKKHGIQDIGCITIEGLITLTFSLISGLVMYLVFNKIVVISHLFFKLVLEGLLFSCVYLMMTLTFRHELVKDFLRVVKR